MIVLGTNVVSELIKQRPDGRVTRWVRQQGWSRFAITALSIFELRFGLALIPPSRRRLDLEALLDEFLASLSVGFCLDLNPDGAALAAAFRANRQKAERPVGVADSLIADIALSHGAALATRNIRDFDGAELELVDPWQAAP